MSEHFLEINEKFYKDYDNWDKAKSNFAFNLGKPTTAFNSNFNPSTKKIIWDASKIIKIKKKHPSMSDDIIKQVPKIISCPTVILLSKSHNSRITLFSELTDNDNFPIIVILELLPSINNSISVDTIKVVSAYGKNHSIQSFIDKSIVLYIDTDIQRIKHWETNFNVSLCDYPTGFNTKNLSEVKKIEPILVVS
ncbi:MAG: hypothetical protein MJ143_00650 [Clostridia bacterium]|nr:hypothetical protein [Clostridia bacterium]